MEYQYIRTPNPQTIPRRRIIGYVGTLYEWFDFELIFAFLGKNHKERNNWNLIVCEPVQMCLLELIR